VNRLRFFTIAHRDLSFCCPLSSAKLDQLVGLLDLPPQAHVLDVGCGKAELLLRVLPRESRRTRTSASFRTHGRRQRNADSTVV
jgi:cyclopropane fatty-acyl-phospholipid synthase-like methyltransferase